jgi:transcriptional regulator with XRE-family HTH domain
MTCVKPDEPITAVVRGAIENSDKSRYEIARLAGVSQAMLSLFVAGKRRGLSTTTLDRLAPVLGLSLSVKAPKKKRKK